MRTPHWRALFLSLALGIGAAASVHATTTTALAISGTPASTVSAGSSYSFTPGVAGANGHTLSFAIVQKPSWASFSGTTGKLSGTPTAANAGSYKDIEIAVNDGVSSAILRTFSIQVTAATGSSTPAPPPTTTGGALTISGTPPATVSAGSSYSFTPAVSGANGRTLSFAIVQKPSWASFNGSTGQLTGTPTSANVGSYKDIEIAVNNGISSAISSTFSVQVTSGSSTSTTDKVTISGTPAPSVTAGSSYKFQPSATDSAGRTLSYSVAHAPSWATFSIASGALSGTPTTSQTGSYTGVVISASDGQASSALPAFTITVTAAAAATGSATLYWTDPTKNTDGSALTDLAGMRIHYGTSAANLSQEVQVAGSGTTSYTITNLPAGTWYFGAAAYTTTGIEGQLSTVASKTID